MKKKLLFYALPLMAVLPFVSCGDDDEEENNNDTLKKETPSNKPVAVPEYVDLGLPSGTLWATFNVGATKPEERGDFFAWGETTPKEQYDWNTYKHAVAHFVPECESGTWECEDEYWTPDSLTKYNSGRYLPGTIDNLSVLLPEDDAATANWGTDWRMPTIEEMLELIVNCEYSRTILNGVKCAKFSSSNGNYILLPMTGYENDWEDEGIIKAEDSGYYWSSSLYNTNPDDSHYGASYIEHDESAQWMMLHEDNATLDNDGTRKSGLCIRPVRANK